jgi:hypothetical protein
MFHQYFFLNLNENAKIWYELYNVANKCVC